jgi:hypothetical protein
MIVEVLESIGAAMGLVQPSKQERIPHPVRVVGYLFGGALLLLAAVTLIAWLVSG